MIVITGATGHTGKPAAEALLAGGAMCASSAATRRSLTSLWPGARTLSSATSKTGTRWPKAFEGADAVYLVVPEDATAAGFASASGACF